MHHIYTTESIVLKRQPQNSSAYYYILTRDLGLITARAQGVRESKSRLKGALQEFSLSTVAYVRGKAGWKITTAIPEKNFWNETKNKQARKKMAHIADSLVRLITGEEKNLKIFTAVSKGFSLFADDGQDLSAVEVIILARILHLLGLLASSADTKELLKDYGDFGPEVTSFASDHAALIIRAINRGFKESQL